MATSTNTWPGLLQTLAAGLNQASMAKKHRNAIPLAVTRDFSPQVADVFSVINTNIMSSTYQTTNLPQGGGTEATPVNVNISPGPVTLNQHPVVVLDLPNMDTTLAGTSYITKVVDEVYKTVSNQINKNLASVFTAAKFSAYPPVNGTNFPENSNFSGNAISTAQNVTSTAFMAAWNLLAANQVPVGAIGDFFMLMPSQVYGNVLLNPNMVMAAQVGDALAGLVSTTARFSSRFGCIFDWDPDLNGLTPEVAIVMHRYAIALVSRAVAAPRNPSVPCTYAELFPGANGEPGISARLVIDFWPPAAADRLLVDCLYGFDVVRPDHGALIDISATMMAAEAGGEGWQQDYPAPAVETHVEPAKHGKK